ncbi:MAG: hypothetical protein ACXACP_04870 [Candidatus Hodarchaeales archaeon]|jgi:hypothetical protein
MKESLDLPISTDTDNKNQNYNLNPWLYWILITGGSVAIILGLFLSLSVIIVSTQQNQANYINGLLVSLLLLIGGISLLIGTVIMNNWSPPEPNLPLEDS